MNIQKQLQQRAFSAAIGPDDPQRAPLFNGERDLLEDQLLPISKVQMFDFDNRRHGRILYAQPHFHPNNGLFGNPRARQTILPTFTLAPLRQGSYISFNVLKQILCLLEAL